MTDRAAYGTSAPAPAAPDDGRLIGRALGVSFGLHALAVAAAAIGLSSPPANAPETPTLGNVTMITDAEFQAALATAPTAGPVRDGIANAGVVDPGAAPEPPVRDPRPETPAENEPVATAPEPEAESVPEADPEPEPAEPAPEAEAPDIAPPENPVPSEPVRPTIAEIPVPDAPARQAERPESPPATDPLQPLASTAADTPEAAPAAPALPAPEPEPAPEAAPEIAEAPAPEAEADRPEAEPEAPARAPEVATIPAARPARTAAAAPASGPVEERARPEPEPEPETRTAETPDEAQAIEDALAAVLSEGEGEGPAGPAGEVEGQRATAPTFAEQVTRGEREALSIGIRRFFVFNDGLADPSLAVEVAVSFRPDGTIESGPERVSARGGDLGMQAALYGAARRAVIRAAAAGVFAELPREKYAAWRRMIITFTPDGERFETAS